MQRKIAKIYENLLHHHGEDAKRELWDKSVMFFNREMQLLPENEREMIIEMALGNALNYSVKPVIPELIIAFMLHPLVQTNTSLLEKIKIELSFDVFKLIYTLQKAQELKDLKVHDHSLLEHTINTLLIMAELKPDIDALLAAGLKPLVEQEKITLIEIETDFGHEVVQLIEKTSRLQNIATNKFAKKEDLHQLFLAMSQDIRVIVIKICSLLDLLRHIEKVHDNHRLRLATEAMEIYAPIADILGIWRLKWQLEDFAFKFINPDEYLKIEKRFNVDEKQNREKYIEKTKNQIIQRAKDLGIPCSVDGRFKHFYSIYTKMREKNKNFDEINDVFALRVVTDTEDNCYRLLGIIHSLWKPKPKRIKDYIALPKENNYRSLHTTVFGINNRTTEFQIRTTAMHDQARFGVAAHWAYKNKKHLIPDWIRSMFHLNQNSFSEKLWQKVTDDILAEKIFVYTPKGDIITLPAGSTPIDFAYHIHTQVGHHCSGAKVNSESVPLNQTLKNEDTVEIITNSNQEGPDPNWRDFVISVPAQKALHQYFEHQPKNKIEEQTFY